MWESIKLGDLAEFKNGLNYSKENWGKGLKVIGVSNFQDYFYPRYEELDEINPTNVVRETDLLNEGDILFVRSNGNPQLIGRSLLIKNLREKVSHSGFTIRLRFLSKRAYPLFYAYLFRTSLIRQTLSQQGGGTNINNLNQKILSQLDVPLPPLKVQKKIAGFLNAYDELIENNKRQIEKLERLAEEIYKEWFVRFRFPGYENTKFEKGIPEGWKEVDFHQLYNISYGKNLPISKLSQVGKFPVYGAGAIIGYFEQFNISQKIVLITCRGNGSGTVWYTNHERAFVTNNSFMISQVNSDTPFHYYYIYLHMLHSPISQAIGGSAQPQITIDSLRKVKIFIPPDYIVREFSDFISPIEALMGYLKMQITNSINTRDLLLPRLISGKLSVADLDIAFPPSMIEEEKAEDAQLHI